MTPEEKKKWDVLQEQKVLYKAEMRKKQEAKDKMEKQHAYDAREKALNKTEASKANPNLKGFGGGEKAVFKQAEP